MKAIGGVQPYPTLAMLGEKTIWTMPHDLAAAGVEPGERVALVALDEPPKDGIAALLRAGAPASLAAPLITGGRSLPLGAVAGTATVTEALPIVGDPEEADECISPDGEGALYRFLDVEDIGVPITDQLPLGDFTPGRWGWLLSDPQPLTKPCEACSGEVWPEGFHQGADPCTVCACGRVPADPIPCKGRQGVFELPADIAEQIA